MSPRPDNGYRFALIRNGEPDYDAHFVLPSVTEILDVIAKPILIDWAAKATRTGIAGLLEKDGLKGATQQDLASMLKAAGTNHRSLSAAGRDRGTKVHGLAETVLFQRAAGVTDPKLTEDEAAVADTGAGSACLEWIEKREPMPLALERSVFSLRYGYAGTFDALLELRIDDVPDPVMTDFKTGKAGAPIYPETHLQTSAYRKAWGEMNPDLQARASLGVVFRDDGTFEEAWLLDDFDSFLGVKVLYDFMKGIAS